MNTKEKKQTEERTSIGKYLPKIAIFIDGGNIFKTGLDYFNKRVLPEKLVNIFYRYPYNFKEIQEKYYFDCENAENAAQIRFHNHLREDHGFKVFTEPLTFRKYNKLECKYCGTIIVPRKCDKCNGEVMLPKHVAKRIDVSIVVEIMDRCDNFDEIILCTGDADFIPLIRKIRNKGKKVHLASFYKALHTDYMKKDEFTKKKRVDNLIYLDLFIDEIT